MLPGASVGWRCTCVHGPASDVLPGSGIPSAAPAHGKSARGDGGSVQRSLSFAVSAQTRHDTCSPISNGIGSGKALTFILLMRSSSHLGRILLPERSNLIQSHWSNQWLTI